MSAGPEVRRGARAWLRIALRELAGGLGGFWIYLACLALGVGAIAAAGSVTTGFIRGLDGQSRMLLGGDASLTVSQRQATPDERRWMEARGRVSEVAGVDAMGRANDVVRQVDLRGIDDAFPLIGAFTFNEGAPPLTDILAERDGVWGLAGSATLLDEFKLRIGDRIDLGGFTAEIRARLDAEPDRIGEPGAFGPRAIIHIDALDAAGQLTPGRLFRTTYRLLLDPEDAGGFEKAAEAELGEKGYRFSGPEDAVDGLQNLLSMLNSFMAVIGVAALVAGGVGVAQATSSFLETRIESIAALKALGADGGSIRAAYGLQLGALAVLGSAIGVAIGAAAPFLLDLYAGSDIPLPNAVGVYVWPLAKAFVLGLLAAVMFATPALGRARATPPAALFRRLGAENTTKTPWPERIAAGLAGVGLAVVAMLGSPQPLVTLALLAGAGVTYLVLFGAAVLIQKVAARAALGSKRFARLALANLGGPGSLAPTVAPALGLGLALLALVATTQDNLLRQIRETAPSNAPSLVFRQIADADAKSFDALMAAEGIAVGDPESYRRAPFLLGRIITLKGLPITPEMVDPSERWVTEGETGLTYVAEKPPEADLRSGEWWAADYSGPLLVSVEEGVARGLRLGVGDRIGFRVFGREVEAEVASIRRVDWSGFGANVAFVLSPGALEAAKPFHVAIAKADREREDAIVKAVADRYPDVLAFQVGRALETAADLFDQVATAVAAAAFVVTLAGILVLFGAFAAAARRRRTEAALLKTFGATRGAILALYAAEFGLAGAAAALIGAGLGAGAAWPVVTEVFEARWGFSIWPVAAVCGVATLAAALGGAGVGWAALSDKPARVLRSV
ncbi:FtsX-like permease family protein [bacterium]|nr:FtsX-like permease family protein [bacterium]